MDKETDVTEEVMEIEGIRGSGRKILDSIDGLEVREETRDIVEAVKDKVIQAQHIHYRTMEKRKDDIEKSLELFLGGHTLKQIQELLNNDGRSEQEKIGVMTVYGDMRLALLEWRKRFIDDINVVLARELQRIDELESEYWSAWRRSTVPVETLMEYTEREGEGEEGRRGRSKKVKTGHGDVEFLRGVERTMAMRHKILGLGQTKTVNINWREEATRSGLNPDEIVDAIVTNIVEANANRQDIEEDVKLLPDVDMG